MRRRALLLLLAPAAGFLLGLAVAPVADPGGDSPPLGVEPPPRPAAPDPPSPEPAAGTREAAPTVSIDWVGLKERSDLWGLEVRVLPAGPVVPPPIGVSWSGWGVGIPMRPPFRAVVPSGAGTLVFGRDGEVLDTRSIEVGEGDHPVELLVPPPDRLRRAVVEVRTDRGGAIEAPAMIVEVTRVEDGRTSRARLRPEVLPRGDGLFLIRLDGRWLRRTGGRETAFALEVTSWDLGSVQIPLRLGLETPQAVILPERIPVTIELGNYVGHPIQGGGFVTWGEGEEPRSWQTSRPDLRGFSRARLRPGPHVFHHGQVGITDLPEVRASISGVSDSILLSLPPLFSVRILVPPEVAVPGEELELILESGLRLRRTVDSRGEARFEGLEPGRHSIVAPDGSGQVIVIPAAGPLRFSPVRPNGYLVGSSGAEVHAAYGLEVGVCIREIDGVPVGRFADLDAVVRTLPGARTVTVGSWGASEVRSLPEGERGRVPLSLAPRFEGEP